MVALQRFRFHLDATELQLNGEAAHDIFLRRLAQVAPSLATQIHHATEKPFAIADLATGEPGFTVSSLIPDLTSALSGMSGVIPVDPAPLPYEALFDFRRHPRDVGFRFLSPTSFRRQGEQILLPDPDLVFGGLLQRFNRFSPFPLPEEVRPQLGRLRISRYDLRTSIVPFSRYSVIGFTGRLTYAFPPEFPPDTAYLAAALARFARFSGIGYKTTMGLGQAEPIEQGVTT